jgi:hypothetical protein
MAVEDGHVHATMGCRFGSAHDMSEMKRISPACSVLVLLLFGLSAHAQTILPDGRVVNPPPSAFGPQPWSPTPGAMGPSVVTPSAAPPSFGDRVTPCLHEGAAAGLGPGDRAAYSRGCANAR